MNYCLKTNINFSLFEKIKKTWLQQRQGQATRYIVIKILCSELVVKFLQLTNQN